MKLIGFIAILLLAALPIVQAPADEVPSGSGYVSALPTPEVTVSAGKPAVVKLQFSVKSGYHINSSHPYSDFQIPTRLDLEAPKEIGIQRVTYPEGSDLTLSFSPEKLSVYSGDFTVLANVSAVRSAGLGSYHVQGVLHYQACSDRACFPPKQLPVSFEVKVVAARGASSAKHK